MEIEEVKKRKSKAEEKINDILQKFTEDTDLTIEKIEVLRQLACGTNPARVIGVILEITI